MIDFLIGMWLGATLISIAVLTAFIRGKIQFVDERHGPQDDYQGEKK